LVDNKFLNLLQVCFEGSIPLLTKNYLEKDIHYLSVKNYNKTAYVITYMNCALNALPGVFGMMGSSTDVKTLQVRQADGSYADIKGGHAYAILFLCCSSISDLVGGITARGLE
jgi:hypothetical protein